MSEKVIHETDHIAAEENGNFERDWREEKWADRKLSVVAQEAVFTEKDMTVRQALKIYKKAVIWCLVISCCVIMEGFDTNLLGNFYAYPSFVSPGLLLLMFQLALPSPIKADLDI